LSVVAVIFLLISVSDLGMSGFDCGAGYLGCSQNWLATEGVWTTVVIVLWATAATWLYRTRKKK
jgi:hypothetical protein